MMSDSKVKINFALTLVLCIQACGSSSAKTEGVETITPSHPAPLVLPPALDVSTKFEVELEGFAVIRELGFLQNAALFGLKPKHGILALSDVTGPAFLKLGFHRELNTTSVPLLFRDLDAPMSETEKSDLLEKHQGSLVIYFEKYEGSLCLGQDNEAIIVVNGKVDGKPFKTSFIFEASPTKNGDCKFRYLNVMTES